MKTGKQVEVFCFRQRKNGVQYLLLKRVLERGGFWQPITGGNEERETLTETVIREILEETGIENPERIIETSFSFTFTDHGHNHEEFVYGVKVDPDTKVTLSDEHNEYKWVDQVVAQKLLVWDGNKKGLEALTKLI